MHRINKEELGLTQEIADHISDMMNEALEEHDFTFPIYGVAVAVNCQVVAFRYDDGEKDGTILCQHNVEPWAFHMSIYLCDRDGHGFKRELGRAVRM